jgi:hypothetical protein
MEHYAHAVAELDSCRITRGGLFLDKAHSGEIRKFALAYRALPREKFETVGTQTDPVAVRTLVRDGRRYLYLVNRDYYPVEVQLRCEPAALGITDLATGASFRAAASPWRITLGAYELRSFALPEHARIAGFTVHPPEGIARALRAEATEAVSALRRAEESGALIPGAERLRSGIESAMAEGRLAWLRRALSSYIVRAARTRV